MKKQRPVNLELSTIKLPPAGIASILHRISGVIMLVLVGLLVWLLATSLQSREGFVQAQQVLANPFMKFLIWGFLTALGYHLLAGIRHIVMDLGFFEELQAGKVTAYLAIGLAVVLSVLAGIWIW